MEKEIDFFNSEYPKKKSFLNPYQLLAMVSASTLVTFLLLEVFRQGNLMSLTTLMLLGCGYYLNTTLFKIFSHTHEKNNGVCDIISAKKTNEEVFEFK